MKIVLNVTKKPLKEARKGFSLHARAQSTHATTKMYASVKGIKIRERREEKIDLVAR